MKSFFKKVLILSWKCQILRRRSLTLTILELVIPIGMFIILSQTYNQLSVKQGSKSTETYSSFSYTMYFFGLEIFNVAYTPQDDFINSIMEDFVKLITEIVQSTANITREPIQNESKLNQWLKEKSLSYSATYPIETDMGLVFSSLDPSKYLYKYKIRTSDPKMTTNILDNDITTKINAYTPMFLGTQIVLDQTLLQHAGFTDEFILYFDQLPSKESGLLMVTQALLWFLCIAYLFLLVSLVKDVVDEKECGTKELMKVMGVDSWMIWLHWFVYSMIIQLPVIIAITIILTAWKPIVISASPLIVFILFSLFTINLIVMVFVVSCLFYKTTKAVSYSLLGWIIVFSMIHILVVGKPDSISFFMELILSLIPPLNLCWALSSLWSFYFYGETWMWSKLFTQGFTKFQISVGVSIISFIVSTILFTLVLIYLDAILPGPYGVPKQLNFICHWIRERISANEPIEYSEVVHDSPENFEPAGKSARAGIALRGLHKKFGFFQKVVAVEHVDLDIYQGEIMALLGHNGAGKTTTMSMITGMTAPSTGTILFEGEDITVNKSRFRENLGLCPQHNLYFTKLTVIEHLMFFGMLKGMSYSESKRVGKSLLYSLNMLEKENTRGSKLSGGMQRRLCLAVSLTGNPKVVILDEPTSGLDPQTRRLLWDIILKMRGERTVLITTHFMEEADVLGDRIAIMDHGRVVCCGTSLFLKKLFGTGYQVHILKTPEASLSDISSVVKQYVPKPQVNVVSNMQVDYIIKEEHVDKFPALFTALERQKGSLDITAITVTCASLEDVFLKVAKLSIGDSSKKATDNHSLSKSKDIVEFERLEGMDLFCQQIKGLLAKRIIHRQRQIFSFFGKLFFILIAMIFLAITTQITRIKYEKQKELLLNLSLYPNSTALLAFDEHFQGFGELSEKVALLLSGEVRVFPKISTLNEYLVKESTDNNYEYVRKVLFALTFEWDEILKVVIRRHEGMKEHAPAIAVNFLSNLLLQNKTNGTGLIQVVNYPFVNIDASGVCPRNIHSDLAKEIGIIYPFLFLFSVAFMIFFSEFLYFITEERVTGFKHQQFLAGASPSVYWLVNLMFDFSVYLIVAVLLLILFVIFGPKIILIRLVWFGLLLLVIILQGVGSISLTYIYSFFVDNQGTSLNIYSNLMFCLGVLCPIIVSTGVLSLFKVITFPIFLIVVCLLCLIPLSASVLCLRYIIRAIVFEEFCRVCQDELCPTEISEVLRMPTKDDRSGILLYLYFLIFTSFLYPLIILLIDYGLITKIILLFSNTEPDFSAPINADEDVIKETTKVKAYKYEGTETPLRVESLEKKYLFGPRAVDKVSFVVLKGDCFGLLGVNGAGKSTTFKMLTAEIRPDKGDAVTGSMSVKRDRIEYMSSVGYCPQFDAILPILTGQEMLMTIAKIRGVPSSDVRGLVETWLNAMGISEHAEKRCGSYSGGTKRKLSTAMALIGSPEVVFLDEPTTGVDPASRRMLWSVIKELQKQGQAVVLTSHSMEECEALCTRLTIMVAGRMKCVGNVEYLKTKYGKGFTVLIKLNDHMPEEVDQLKEDFDRVFSDNVIKDEHAILIHYTVLDPKMSLSILFTDMLKFKKDHKIVADFTASNTTLEELFLSFASNTQQRPVN